MAKKQLQNAVNLIEEAISNIREGVALSEVEEQAGVLIYDLQRAQSEIDFLIDEVKEEA